MCRFKTIIKFLNVVFFLFFLCISSFGQDQRNKIDSLLKQAENTASEKEKSKLYLDIGNLFNTNPDSALYYFKSSRDISEKNDFKELESIALRYIGNGYYEKGNYPTAMDYYKMSLNIATQINDENSMAACYNNIGLINRIYGNYTEAIDLYMKALKINEKYSDSAGISSSYNNIGIVHNIQENYDKAIYYYTMSLQIDERLNDKFGVAIVNNNIGIIYSETGEYDKAISYYKASLETFQQIDYTKGIIQCYTNIGSASLYLDNYENAKKYTLNALELNKTEQDTNGLSTSYNSLSEIYIRLANQESGADRKKYLQTAYDYAMYAYQLSLKTEITPNLNQAAKNLLDIKKLMGHYEEALRYAEIYIVTKDSMFNKEKTKVLTEMNTRYEMQKKQQEIEKQIVIIEKQKAEFNKQKMQRNLLAIITLFIVLLSTAIIYGFILIRNRNKRLKRAYQDLSLSENKLRQLVSTKDRLFSIIAHDLKDPFSALLGMSELLARKSLTLSAEKLVVFSESIHKSSKNLIVLIDNLLQWARSQSGSLTIDRKILLFNKICTDVISTLQMQAKSKGVNLKMNVNEDVVVYADVNTLSFIIRNITSNAIKFSSENDIVSLFAYNKDSKIHIEISDTGVGISEDNLKKLFKVEESFSTHGTNHEKGTGLGLIVCKEFIEKNYGTISVKSKLGSGTTFYITLPSEP